MLRIHFGWLWRGLHSRLKSTAPWIIDVMMPIMAPKVKRGRVGMATLYGVETRRLNEQVRRNTKRFPADFVFQVTPAEFVNLKSQIATSSWGGRRKLPLAFTEHGAIMAAMVLQSPRATEVSVYVVRAFVQLRDTLIANKELARRLEELESRIERKLSTHDQAIAGILDAIRQLMAPSPASKKRPIGFVHDT